MGAKKVMKVICLSTIIVLYAHCLCYASDWSSATSPLSSTGFEIHSTTSSGFWLYTTISGNAHFYYSTDNGSSYHQYENSLFTPTSILEDGKGTLYAWDESKGELYNSSDHGSSWTDLTENATFAYTNPVLQGSADLGLYIVHQNGLAAINLNSSSYEVKDLFTLNDSFPKLSIQSSQLDLVYKSDNKLLAQRSSDDGSTWANLNAVTSSINSSDNILHLIYTNSLDGSLCLESGNTLTVYHTIDGGSSWTGSTVTSSRDAVYPAKLESIHDIEYLFFQASGKATLAIRTDFDSLWRSVTPDSWQGNVITSMVDDYGRVLLWSDQQLQFQMFNPFTLAPLDGGSLRNDWSEAILMWPYHPHAKSYDIELNNVTVDSTTSPPYTYPARVNANDIFKVTPILDSTRGDAITLGVQQGAETQLEILIEESSLNLGFKMISFPSGSRVQDREDLLSPLAYLERYLGPEHDPSIWRFGHWQSASADYIYGNSVGEATSGKAFWIISKFNISFQITTDNFQPTYLSQQLQPGWNMIATPYPEETSWSTMSIRDRLREWTYSELLKSRSRPVYPQLWQWNGDHYELSDTLSPGQGYWVKNDSTRNLLLKLQSSSNGKAIVFEKPIRLASDETPPNPPDSEFSVESTTSGSGGCLINRIR